MNRSRKFVSILLMIVLSATLLFYITPLDVLAEEQSTTKSNEINPKPTFSYVAKVGDEEISKEEYSYFLSCTVDIVQRYLISNSLDWSAKIQNQPAAEFTKQSALESARDFKIQLIKAKDAKISLTKKEIDDLNLKIDTAIKSMASSQAEQEEIFKGLFGLTIAQYRIMNKDLALVQKFINSTKSKYKFGDSDLQKYYISHKDGLYKVTVGHILLLVNDDDDPAFINQVFKKAKDILAKVRKQGSNFAALVKQYSEDYGSIDTAGEYTVTKNGQFVSEFENWALDPARKVGDTGIIKSPYGYHIMKLKKIFSFNEIKSDVKNMFISEKYANDLAIWKKDSKYKLATNKVVFDAIELPSHEPLDAADSPKQNPAPKPDPKATVDNLLGKWVDISDPDRFAIITKADDGYRYEDNESNFPAIFKDGVLKITVYAEKTETDTADAYVDTITGHLFVVFDGEYTEFKKLESTTTTN